VALDPAAQRLVDQVAEAGRPPMEALPVAEARRSSAALLTMLAGPVVVEGVASVADADADGVPVRVYRPAAADGPVVMAFHGGGWMLGSIDEHEPVARALCALGPAVVVSVGYRLAPEHPFPAPLEDCWAATAWAAAELGGERLVVTGDSAGGNLAAAVCLLSVQRGGPAISAQVIGYPALDATMASPSYAGEGEGRLLTAAAMAHFWHTYLAGHDPADPLASPLLADAATLARLPPARVITAEHDPLRDEGEAWAARLRAAGVASVSSRYLGMIHGFAGMGRLFPDQSARALAEAAWAVVASAP
jgi:acetyl esterase